VLGVRPDASVEDIRKAYRALMRRYHPDRLATADAETQRKAGEKAKAINEAYHILARRRNFK
jgi:DnaJ like chaperone protein